jgi:hypothetical protein
MESLNCYKCKHKRTVPGNSHVMCVNPCTHVVGNSHGIKKGWFMYPLLFDPVWGSGCKNFEDSTVSPSVSHSVSQEKQ